MRPNAASSPNRSENAVKPTISAKRMTTCRRSASKQSPPSARRSGRPAPSISISRLCDWLFLLNRQRLTELAPNVGPPKRRTLLPSRPGPRSDGVLITNERKARSPRTSPSLRAETPSVAVFYFLTVWIMIAAVGANQAQAFAKEKSGDFPFRSHDAVWRRQSNDLRRAFLRLATAPDAPVQAVERSAFRRQIARRRRALCRSAGARHRLVGRRKEPDSGA